MPAPVIASPCSSKGMPGDQEPFPGFNSSDQGLLSEISLLLQAHHASLLEQVERRFEDLSSRITSASARGPTAVVPAVPAKARSTTFAAHTRHVQCRTFSESMAMKKKTAARVAKLAVLDRLPSASIDRTLTSRKRCFSWPRFKGLNQFVNSTFFECLSTLFIVANTIFFGVETDLMVRQVSSDLVDVVNVVFTLVFLIELLIRFFAGPRDLFQSPQRVWNVLDTVVVTVSVVELYFRIARLDSDFNLANLRIIRVARLARIFRVLRFLKSFSSLRILVHCVLNSMRSLLWTIFLLALVLYVFGILFTQAAVDHLGSPERATSLWDADLTDYWGSLPTSMYTLFQSVTGGVSWKEVARPLRQVSLFMEALFNCYICFTYFAVLNVVTGVFCQSAIESAAHDKDMKVQTQLSNKRLYTQQLRDLFEAIDERNKGTLDFGMLERCLADPLFEAYFDAMGISASDAWNLFKLLDGEESNQIDLEEFVEGCLRLRGSARSIDSHMLLYESRWTMNKVTALCKSFNELLGQLATAGPTNSDEFAGMEIAVDREPGFMRDSKVLKDRLDKAKDTARKSKKESLRSPEGRSSMASSDAFFTSTRSSEMVP